MDQDEANSLAATAAPKVIDQLAGSNTSDALRVGAQAVALLAEKLNKQQLLDLLKRPTCVGPLRDVVLRILGRLLEQNFDHVWDMVAWVQQYEPALDLLTPPQPPER
jgi:hypothetical protein